MALRKWCLGFNPPKEKIVKRQLWFPITVIKNKQHAITKTIIKLYLLKKGGWDFKHIFVFGKDLVINSHHNIIMKEIL